MQHRYSVGCSVTKAEYEKLGKIAAYLRRVRGTNGSKSEAMRCLINEVYAKMKPKEK